MYTLGKIKKIITNVYKILKMTTELKQKKIFHKVMDYLDENTQFIF